MEINDFCDNEILIRNIVILKILEKYKIIWALSHLAGLANWDLDTYMPELGLEARGEALAKVSSLIQELFLEKEFIELIKQAENEELNDYEKGIIRLLKRSLKFYQKLPSDFIEEFVKITNEARAYWREARERSDFSIFEPYLEKIIEMSRKKAELLGYQKHPYDALLDEYEEGLITEDVEKYFSSIKRPLIELFHKIKNSKKYSYHELENEEYEIEKMKILNNKIIEVLHNGLKNLRMDISTHPFSISIGKGDARITTRYEGKDFFRSYSSTIHEFGHSLYELQCDDKLYYTPVAGGSSLVIHESQSRFWENFIGRSDGFIELIYNDFVKLGDNFKDYTKEDIYNYFNLVKPGFIRVEADEISYHLHVLIRFEIEKALIEGSINVKDLPKIWNDKYEEYLGIRPRNDREGVLQDVHWSQGSIGYFPTYSIGTCLSAMWKYYLEKDLEKISDLVKTKQGIEKIRKWLKENVHQYGSTYMFKDLVKKSLGKEFDSMYLLDYLKGKYSL